MTICIVYLSASVGRFEEDFLPVILEQSRRNNQQAGVTGVMLYVRGRIVQVLEGENDTLEALYQRIEQDPRHTNVTRVLTRPITQRLFGSWLMGYETITDSQLDELENVLELNSQDGVARGPSTNIVLKTIKVFYDSNRYN